MCLPLGLLIVGFAGLAESDFYKKGGVAVLSPGSVSDPIISIMWKHDLEIAVEWYRKVTEAFRGFRGRCELDTNTGALTISNLSLEDSGSYTPEINSRIMSTIEMTVITAVPKPTISTHCSPEETQCTLTCDATITDDMGTVNYTWEIGDRQRASSSNQLDITKDDTELFGKQISCNLTNPVSSERSPGIIIMSPFTNLSSWNVIIAAVMVLVVLFMVSAGLVFCLKRRPQNAHPRWRQNFDPRRCLNPECAKQVAQQVLKAGKAPSAHAQSNGDGGTEGTAEERAPLVTIYKNGVVTFSVKNETHNQEQNLGSPDAKNETNEPEEDSEDKVTSDPKMESAGKSENSNETIQLAAPTSEVQEELSRGQTPPGSADTVSDSAVKQEPEQEQEEEEEAAT